MDDAPPRTIARDERRQAIIEIAREVFRSEGFAAASMSAIAARVGGSKGTLYNYFPSKEALFAAVVQDYCGRRQAEIYDLPIDGSHIEATLKTLGRRHTELMLSDEVLATQRLVVAESVRFPEIGQALYEAGPRRGLQRLIPYVEEAMASGRLRKANAARAAEQFLDLCLSGFYRLRLWNAGPPPAPAEIEANVDAAVEVFMAAYGRRRA